MTIDAYVAALVRLLPLCARLRAPSEVREHLRDAAAAHRAAGLSPRDAEVAATTAFGPVEDVARRLRSEVAVLETRLATAFALAAVTSFVFPLYVVPENTLPPASWAEKPVDILLLQLVTVGIWGAAGVLASVSAILAWTRWSRFAAPLLDLVAPAIAASILVSVALVVRWYMEATVPGWWPLLSALLGGGCLAVCVVSAGWARSRRLRLAA